jgi:prepilin-type N-terminal cleavage/methylation domain-containing protein
MSRTSNTRRGFTLAEVIAATAILAVLTTSSFALVRTANDAWRRHRDDSMQRSEAIAALQHLVRRIRQAAQVTAISAAADASGTITLQMADGTSAIWDHDAATNSILYGTATPTGLLAEGITQLSFMGLTANGFSVTTDVTKIHAVLCTVRFTLNRPTGPVTETVTNLAWLRAW